MYTKSVRGLRADLATAIRRAEAGDNTVVTVHGRAVAMLAPLTAPPSSGSVSFDQLVATGSLLPARRRTPWRPGEPVPVWAGTRIDQALREVRG